MAWKKDAGWHDGAIATIDAVIEAVEVLRHRAGQEGCWDSLWNVRGMHLCPVPLLDLDWKVWPSFLRGWQQPELGLGCRVLLPVGWEVSLHPWQAMQGRFASLKIPLQWCPKKGNENGLRNLRNAHSCFKNLLPYFQHISAVSVMAIGLPKLSSISLLQCNEGLLPQ